MAASVISALFIANLHAPGGGRTIARRKPDRRTTARRKLGGRAFAERKGIYTMYQNDYEKNKQEQADGAAGYPADDQNGCGRQMGSAEGTIQGSDVNFTMRDPEEKESTGTGSQEQSASGSNYGSGQSGQNYSYGSGQSNQNYNYGSGQSGQNSGYGSSQSGQNYSYGSGQSGQNSGYGSSQSGQNYSYGSGQSGQNSGYGSGRQGQNYNYGSGQSNQNSGYGSGRPDQNHSYGSQQPNQNYAPWQQPQQFQQQNQKPGRKKKPNSILKKAAGITAAALLFGVVAGGTISGINLVTSRIASSYAADETQTTLSQAETLPAPTQPAAGNGGNSAASATPAITNDVSAIVEKAMPSVVAINSVMEYQTQNWFGQPQVYQGKGSGSGIIVGESDTELLVVTNNHVVEGAKTIGVVFADNESVEANIKGTDSENDLAVVAVALDKIPDSTKSKIAVATLGDSDSLKVGQGVIAIGNALGYGQSVTVGYVSALDREVKTNEQTTRNLLQTDAAINPGNSGGALLNMRGEVVGINSAKYSSTEVEGMGYAIPISKVHDIIDNLMTKKTRIQIEEAKQGYLGIQGTDIDSNASTLYGMPQGIFIYKIMDGGAAASSDLKEKDIITKFDGQSVRSMSELKNMLTYYAGGDTVQVTVQSLVDGQYVERQVELTLGTKPEEESTN